MLQRNTSELVAGLDERRRKLAESRHSIGQGPKRLCFLRHFKPALPVSSWSIRRNRPFAIAMLHRKIVACKRYLAAALGTLTIEAERQQTPDFWHRRRQFLPELPKSRARVCRIFRGNFRKCTYDIHSSRKLAAALVAGLIAIVVNTAMLEAADWIPLSPLEAAS